MTSTDKVNDNIVRCSSCRLRFFKEDMGMNRLKEVFRCCPKCRDHSKNMRHKRLNKQANTNNEHVPLENQERGHIPTDNHSSLVQEDNTNENIVEIDTNVIRDNESPSCQESSDINSEESFGDVFSKFLMDDEDATLILENKDSSGTDMIFIKVDGKVMKVDDNNLFGSVMLALVGTAFEKIPQIFYKIYLQLEKAKEANLICDSLSQVLKPLNTLGFTVALMGGSFERSDILQNNYAKRQVYRHLHENNSILFVPIYREYPDGTSNNTPLGLRDLKILFTVGDNIIHEYEIPAIDLFSGFMIQERFKNKKRCDICYQKDSKSFTSCGTCSKKCCSDCYRKINNKHCCSFCRTTILDFMLKRSKVLEVDNLILKLDDIVVE